MNDDLMVSAIVCTHNRSSYLPRALESLATQTLPPCNYEVIVVDNASKDNSVETVEAFRDHISNLICLREERLGLSWARNAGAQRARGRYIAYLDDDARAEPQWLEMILRAFEGVNPTPAAVGGRVWLDWEPEPPAWLPRRYWSLYTYVDHGDQGHFLLDSEYLVGANIAFRKNTLLEMGGFDTHLGRQGATLLSGEEAALLRQLRERHWGVYYEPKAVVWHAVLDARRHKRWLWKRMFWDGASQPLLNYDIAQPRRFYALQAYYDLRRVVFFAFQWFHTFVRGDTDQCLDDGLSLVQRIGRLRANLALVFGHIRRSTYSKSNSGQGGG